MGLGDFRFGTWALGGQAEGQSFNHPYQRLGFYGALGLGLGDFRFGTEALGGQAEGQSFNHPYQRLGFYGALGLGLGGFRFGTGALGGQGEGQSFRTRLGLGEGQNTVSGREMQIQTMHTCSFVVRKYFLVLNCTTATAPATK